jgi:membrane carboxypeptidase/penicillin-binding protein
MRRIHAGSPVQDFERPTSGLIQVAVNARSGLLPSGDEPIIHEWFLSGTEPKTRDTLTSTRAAIREATANHLRTALATIDVDPPLFQAPLDEPSAGAGQSAPADGNPLLD